MEKFVYLYLGSVLGEQAIDTYLNPILPVELKYHAISRELITHGEGRTRKKEL